MKIASVNSYQTSNTKRFKDFHEIQEDLNEIARQEAKARDQYNVNRNVEFKFQEEVNKEKRAQYNPPLHVVLQNEMLKKLNVF